MVQIVKNSNARITQGDYWGGPFDANYFFGNHEGGYTNYADYGGNRSQIIINRADDIEAQTGLVNGKDVLVVACAFGYLVNELANRGATVTGLDISSYAIGQAETLFPALNFVTTDALTTGFSNNVFDLIIANGIIMCMPNQSTLMSLFTELKRILKGNGSLYALSDLTPPWYIVFTNEELEEWVGAIPGWTITITNTGELPITADRRIVID